MSSFKGKSCFEESARLIPIGAIKGYEPANKAIKSSQKYRQIYASVAAIGLVELPVVFPDATGQNSYFLLDGRLRLEALKELGVGEVECLVSTDDEAYTYNRRINRLSVVQEHRMIVRAVERGVPEEQIACALNVSPATIKQRFRLLDGLCQEAIDLIATKHNCTMIVIEILKQMKPIRQIQAAELIVGQNNFSSGFARSILAATPDEQLTKTKLTSADVAVARDQIARLERELEATQRRTRFVEDSFGDDTLCLTIAQAYLNKILRKPRAVHWLTENHAEVLGELQAIASLDSLVSPSLPGTQTK